MLCNFSILTGTDVSRAADCGALDCVVSTGHLGRSFAMLSVELSSFLGPYEVAHLYCVQFFYVFQF